MRNFPVFTTQHGVASLILREVPYWQTAYIKICDSMEPELLLKDCRDFALAVGAERIYASGHDCLAEYPFHTAVWNMTAQTASMPQTAAQAVPVTAKTLAQWKDIYNSKMASVANASYMDNARGNELLQTGDGFFIYHGSELLGIGKAAGSVIDAVAAIQPGSGQDIVAALCKMLDTDTVTLQVASANIRAVKLYERLKFLKTEELSRWYQIL